MTKPTIRIHFVDYYDPIDKFFVTLLSDDFNIIRDSTNPEYLFFCDETFGTSNLSYDLNNVVKIFFTGENRRPDNYLAHHKISFDHRTDSVHFRLPLWAVEHWFMINKFGLEIDLYKSRDFHPDEFDSRRFCSFVVANPSCVERNMAFHEISHKYQKVDSAGPLFNNVGFLLPRDEYGIIHKLNFLKGYKFNLCYENSAYPGYVTEKLYHALIADTIPIYWGSPTVLADFNGEAFIDAQKFSSNDELISHISRLTVAQCSDMLKAPIRPASLRNQDYYNNFKEWFKHSVYRG